MDLARLQAQRDQVVHRLSTLIKPQDPRIIDKTAKPQFTTVPVDPSIFYDRRKDQFDQQLDAQFQMNLQHLAFSRTIQPDHYLSKTLDH